MSTTPTTHYAFGKPAVGGDNGSWGTELNAVIDAIDTTVFGVSGVANAALPAAGGAMTGRLDALTGTMQIKTFGSVSGALTFNLLLAQYQTFTVGGAVTSITLTNVPATATSACGLIFKVTNGGAFAVTWPASFKWPGGVAPTLTVSGVDLLAFITDDNGTTWRLIGIQLNIH